jgi:hypothetical protein
VDGGGFIARNILFHVVAPCSLPASLVTSYTDVQTRHLSEIHFGALIFRVPHKNNFCALDVALWLYISVV